MADKDRELSKSELEFVRLVAAGVAKADAYRKATGKNELSEAVARAGAAKWLHKERIRASLEANQKQAQQVVLSRDVPAVLAKQEFLAEVLALARSAERDSDALRGYEIYGKFAYGNEPTVQVNTQVNCVNSEVDFSSLMKSIVK